MKIRGRSCLSQGKMWFALSYGSLFHRGPVPKPVRQPEFFRSPPRGGSYFQRPPSFFAFLKKGGKEKTKGQTTAFKIPFSFGFLRPAQPTGIRAATPTHVATAAVICPEFVLHSRHGYRSGILMVAPYGRSWRMTRTVSPGCLVILALISLRIPRICPGVPMRTRLPS